MASGDADQEHIAQIAEIAGRYAIRRHLDDAEADQVAAELAEAAAGRADLLARYAGITLGFHEKDADAGRYERAAQLCIRAGADTALILRWIDVGRRARLRPGTGIMRPASELIRGQITAAAPGCGGRRAPAAPRLVQTNPRTLPQLGRGGAAMDRWSRLRTLGHSYGAFLVLQHAVDHRGEPRGTIVSGALLAT